MTQPPRLRGTLIADRNLAAEIEIGPVEVDTNWLREHINELADSLVYSIPQVFADLIIWPDPEKFPRPINVGQIDKVELNGHHGKFIVRTHRLPPQGNGHLFVRLAPGLTVPSMR